MGKSLESHIIKNNLKVQQKDKVSKYTCWIFDKSKTLMKTFILQLIQRQNYRAEILRK